MILPNLAYEKKLWKEGWLVIGIDEVGRGAFAGPLVIGDVIFNPLSKKREIKELEALEINDSKILSKIQRERLEIIIKERSYAFNTSFISPTKINKIGISKAFSCGVRKVVNQLKKGLPNRKIYLLIDAFNVKYINGIGITHQKAIIHGDAISLSIAAASIIAKRERDLYMKKLAHQYPEYGFENHVGYGTKAHQKAILIHGVTKNHRTLYLRKLLKKNSYH